MSERKQANMHAPPVEQQQAVPGPSRVEADPGKADQAEASSPPRPLDGGVALQEDRTCVPPSSLETLYVDPDHPNKVLEGLDRLRLSNTLCDVTLCCEGQDFSCHRAVLASISSYFEDLFTSDTVESSEERVSISELEPQAIGLMLNYFYTSTFPSANVQALLAASTSWNVTDVGKAYRVHMQRQKRRLKQAGRIKSDAAPPRFRIVSHPNKVLEGLHRLRLSNTLCDVTLCCEGQDFSCHRAVLASISPYFEAMFTSGMMESMQERVSISGLEPQTIGMLVNYFYTSKLHISTDNVQALLAALNLWDIKAVREKCFDYMLHHIDIENCVEFYCVAEAHSCDSESIWLLDKESLNFILEHFTEVHQQEEFLSLSVEGLTKILSSDHLSVPKEDMVFDAAMLWLDNCPTRKQNFDEVLEHVRLPLISPSYLQHVVESLDVVREQQACQSFISGPFSDTARPRRTTVIVTMGGEAEDWVDYQLMSIDPLTAGERRPIKKWRSLGRLPSETRGHAVVMSGSFVYLAGGWLSTPSKKASKRHDGLVSKKELWRYDVQHNNWLKMADMNEERAFFKLVELDGQVFAVGGQGSEKSPDSMERYDRTTNTWQLMESVGVAAYSDSNSGPAVVALDGHLYFIGGGNSPGVAKYNPATSVWTDVSPMQISRDQPAVCTLNGKIYVTGGRRPNAMNESEGRSLITEDTMECFNPETNQWTMCAPMKERRWWHSAVVVDGKIYVLGGQDVQDRYYPLYMECYYERTNMWELVCRIQRSLFNLNCVPLRLRNDDMTMFYDHVDYDHYDDHDHYDYYGDDDHYDHYDSYHHDHYYGYDDDDDDDYDPWRSWRD